MLLGSSRPWVVGFSLIVVLGCKSPESGETGTETGTPTGTETGAPTGTETGTTTVTTDTPTGTTAPEFDPQGTAESMCSVLVTCQCDEPLYADQAECVTETLAAFDEVESMAAENGLMFDPACITAMADVYSTLGCKYPDEEAYCSLCSVVSGDRQAGEDCTEYAFGSDCAQGLTCVYPGTCIGRCGNIPEGGFCLTSRECADGLGCAEDDTCTVSAGAGDSCVDIPCGDGLVCGVDGICGAPVGGGESCANLCCAEGFFCLNDVCQPQLGAGGACGFNGLTTCNDRCAPGLQCDDDGTGGCVPFRKEGESCDSFGLQCDEYLECEDDVCVPYVYVCDNPYALPWIDL